MCFKGNHTDIVNDILSMDYTQPLAITKQTIKNNIIEKYNTADFELEKLKIGLTELGKYNKLKLRYTIYDSFFDLEDAIDCCMASSHVPFLTGEQIFKKYKNKLAFDGGLKKNSYKKPKSSVLHISSKIWNNKK